MDMKASMGEKGERVAEQEVKYRGWKAMPYVVGNETFEKLGTIGTSSNMVVYLTTVFNMSSVSAATVINVWGGTTNIATILGAFLSDAYLGRFLTLAFASLASFLGMVAITLTAAFPSLHPHQCSTTTTACEGPSSWQFTFLLMGLGLLVIGAGGIRPCNLAFGADQFNPKTEAGKRGINSFFNWYYFTFTIAMMISSTFIIYVQSSVNWALGLAIPAALMLVSCAFFFVGYGIYVRVKPQGSPFTGVVRVAVAAFRKRRLELPSGGHGTGETLSTTILFNPPAPAGSINTRIPHTDQFRFLDKAAILTGEEGVLQPDGTTPANPWRLCTMQQVEEVKCLLRVIPIWSTGIIFYMVMIQQHTYAVFQALQSDRHLTHGSTFQIPAASFVIFSMFGLTFWIPLYDRIIVPRLRKLTGKEEGITLLQRMGIGIFLSILTMITSGLVEQRRRNTALNKPTVGVNGRGGAISSMSSMWLAAQLTMTGLCEAFNMIGQVEFYYKQFPENMRSVAGSFLFCGIAVSSYLSGLLVNVVHRTTRVGGGRENWLAEDLNKGRLDYFYYLIAGMGVVDFVYFLVCARWYRYKRSVVFTEIALEEKDSKAPPV